MQKRQSPEASASKMGLVQTYPTQNSAESNSHYLKIYQVLPLTTQISKSWIEVESITGKEPALELTWGAVVHC